MAHILVIEDDALIRETIRTMLQLEGHEVALAPRAEDGPRHFHQQAVDLVICDVFTPRRGGTETIPAIRRLSPRVPIIAMTGGTRDAPDGDDQEHRRHLQTSRPAGATATIAKPFRPRDLFALIRQCLSGAGLSTTL
jgi:DNA-binding response OmpR family regulator